MKIKEARALITKELKKTKDVTPLQIHQATNAPLIQVYSTLKQLIVLNAISETITDAGKTYSVINASKLDDAFTDADEPKVEKPKTKQIKPTSGRDNSKYIYNKVAYSKSKCVLIVISDYVNKNQPTLDQLRETFPDSIVSQFGVINTLKEAKELSTDRARYHLKNHHILTTSDQKSIAVTNQWTLARFINFMAAAKKVGCKIKPE